MLGPLVALAGAGALLCACLEAPHTTNTAIAGGLLGVAKSCADQGGCGATHPNHKQYYDEQAGRYYYFDSATGRYFWEDGAPR
ncbi:MAG: hypothetical protein E8A12_17925 [Phenylobacterium sp.]|nr:hypothetical protein [Phenylobacterium sp.]THD54015.1 MAG: hypothetical protein E8A12_17925 [Phenylobacterium sp.]